MQKILNNHKLHIAYTGADGLENASQKIYDLILLDINLGEDQMDGCEVLRNLRKMNVYRSCPIFAITAYAQNNDKQRFLSEGFDDYFSKPVDFKKLQTTIDQLSSSSKVASISA